MGIEDSTFYDFNLTLLQIHYRNVEKYNAGNKNFDYQKML